ncbi:MAG: hypothetical protein ACXADY_01645 [Candidatus Hodarchaeales archaeon]
MDEKNDSTIENNKKFHSSKESLEDQSDIITNQVQQKFPSFDFWSSRGNMGEKINLLVGLNLLLINLLSTLVTTLRSEDTPLSNDVITVLTMTQEFLSKTITQPESGLEIPENIETIQLKVTSMLEELSSTSIPTEALEKKPPTVTTEDVIGLFKRKTQIIDKWGIVESTEKLLSSYSNLSHLGFPNYYFAACEELHRYELQQESPLPNQHESMQIPSFKLKTLISKLLREAPAARLLQNLHRMFPSKNDLNPTSTEQNQIQDIVERYYRNISEYLDDGQSVKDSLRVSSGILKSYNLGTGDLESRIPNVSFNVVKEINSELVETPDNDFKKYVLSETIILINRLNDSLLQNERFIFFLRRLK